MSLASADVRVSPPPGARPVELAAERYVGFAFAVADLLIETDLDGEILFAAGAFHTRLGEDAASFLGRPLASLFSPLSHSALDVAMALISHTGRISPMQLILADASATPVSVGALLLRAPDRPVRLSVAIGLLPAIPPSTASEAATALGGSVTSSADFLRTTERLLRGGAAADVSLVEVKGWARVREALSAPERRSLEHAIGEAFSNGEGVSSAGQMSEGRFGVVTQKGADISHLVARLEAALQASPAGPHASVENARLPLDSGGMPTAQAARALRYALRRFADGGQEAAAAAGSAGGLEGIIASAEQHTLAMRAALRERRFRLVYQPVVRISDRSVHHFEALLRPIPTPNVPMHNTQEFVTFAEAVGLSEELDWAVLETAIEALHATSGTSVAVNMSGLSMQNKEYRRRLLARLAELRSEGGKLAASRLLIELTETAEIADLHEAASSMEQLRSVGVPVCLDDFGAGAAAFRYLRAFGVDYVKLDGEYVRAACKNRRDRALVASMIEIAKKSGAAVVAEMIETEAEAAVMAELGVAYGQGWLFGRPGNLPGLR